MIKFRFQPNCGFPLYCTITITGVVQGIGFRPFVYNIAVNHNLQGFVLNRGDAGVEIQIKGTRTSINSFIADLKNKKPPLARYESFQTAFNVQNDILDNYHSFKIEKSSLMQGSSGYIPPDLPICNICIEEMTSDPRRKFYPFTSCVECGPRFTVITSLPYDRPRTVMDQFPLCNDCLTEYSNPNDRRFHAQTTCCWNCGPKYSLIDKKGNIIIDPLSFQSKWQEINTLIKEGYIIAIKGIGGTHLACSTLQDDPIIRLRQWKGARGEKPFAVMSGNIPKVKSFAYCSEDEEKILHSLARPIVLLNKNKDYFLSQFVSPKLHNIGVMLPYAGIHVLLANNTTEPALIMTSANPSNLPTLINNSQIISDLSPIADYFLLHDREIFQRADDSVLRIHDLPSSSRPLFIRKSRGYVPEPISLPWTTPSPNVLALGAEMYNVGALGLKNQCFATQHIGHMSTLENIDFFNDSIQHFRKLLGIKNIEAIGGDLHPDFFTTKLGYRLSEELHVPFYQFQHHHAHLSGLSLDGKANPDDLIICVALDGTGFGSDGNIWGGEILLGNYEEFTRVAHLENQILFGGDKAIVDPLRVLLSILLKGFNIDDLTVCLQSLPWLTWIPQRDDYQILSTQITHSLSKNTSKKIIQTSSTGRILDTISIMLGASRERTYEGEPAIKLESLAEKAKKRSKNLDFDLPISTKSGGKIIIETSPFIFEIWNEIQSNSSLPEIAYAAELAIAKSFAMVAIDCLNQHGASKVGLSGGVAFNRVIFSEFYRILEANNLGKKIIYHHQIPCGDGGIAIGQVPLIQAKLL